MRVLMWFAIWLAFGGMLDIHVVYTDGLKIDAKGWGAWLVRKMWGRRSG